MERSLLLIKPDAVQRDLIGKILTRIEEKGLKIVGLRMFSFDAELLAEHYAHHQGKSFFPELSAYMVSGPSVAVCVEGVDAVATLRQLTGVTKARTAEPGTIRGDLAMSIQKNLVHSSDSVDTALIEIKRFFPDSDLHTYTDALQDQVYTSDELGN